ncbi:MAG: PKD domain-containing protein [Saprospiraceae bacterium]|nr:PKD domain-containing protein [Saprospiraceae bacterium]
MPAPPLLIVQPTTFNGCTPADIFFNNLSTPIDSTYKIEWNFGDNTTAKNIISPTHIYETPGIYSVSLKVTSPIGCSNSRSFTNWIKVNEGIKADFDYSPDKFSTFDKNISLFDKSFPDPTSWQWQIDSVGFSSRKNANFVLRDTGFHSIRLVSRNKFGCADTLVKRVDVVPLSSFWMPNAFTPNGDGTNDYFKGNGYLEGSVGYNMKIWNRWSELVFESSNPLDGWNGKKFNVGEDAPQGVYLCIVTYTEPRGQQRQIKTYATIIR